jgi:amino acid adenylation domain-containing protein
MGSVPDIFAQSVHHSPDAVAVLDYKTSLSYRALDDRSTHLAWQLISAGVKPGDKVAVCTERTVDVVIALLAILKAGAAYLPIEASYPTDRIKFMLNDAGVTLAVADDANRQLFGGQVKVMSTAPAAAVMRAPLPTVTANDLAYVIYTSGSTGTPKGALIEHAGIVRLVCDVSYVRLDREQVLLHAAPVAFDASTFEIWGALLTGGRVVIHRERLPTASGLAATIHDRGVTTAWLTAGLYNAVIDEAPEALAPLSQLLIGGEALSVAHVKRGLELLPNTTIINGYGPTECTTFTTTLTIPRPLPAEWTAIPIGKPIRDTTCFVLDGNREPVAVGDIGELYVGGAGVARGYLAREDLTKERFISHELAQGGRLYRTGDLVRYRADGVIEYVGRTDNQIKIRGFRIELSEIESVLSQHPALSRVVVSVYEPRPSDKRIIAHYSVRTGETADVNELKSFCARTLPEYMVPSAVMQVKEFPLTSNGKVDLRALPLPEAKLATQTQPTSEREKQIAAVLAEVLGLPAIGNDDHFFDLGGSSLLALRAIARLESRFGLRFSVTDLFDRPTPRQLATDASSEASVPLDEPSMLREPVAIIGMAGRFPGADNIDTLWKNLCAGVEALTTFKREELHPLAQQIAAQEADYVSKRGVLSDIKRFDAAFFNIHAREAELMDPQQRLLLETAWATLENAGYVPESVPGHRIGAFAGAYNNSYFTHHVSKRPDLIERLGAFQVMLANEKDYVATRLAHKLDLRGPALSIHTACSTSLVAIAQAVESLWLGACDLAIAGGVSLTCPPNSGYVYQEGGMLSADGHTRSFNEGSTGTTFGDGVAMVALKRLSAAQRDGDTIYAVIHGTGVNNDGGEKASFTAPSTRGQKEAIRRAQRTAHVNARVMSYIEAHGTATPIGDPIEVEALREAFAHDTKDTQFCGIGSVKSNLGHLVAAAGATGLIKTALALHHEKIPATIGFEQPNRAIDFSNTPFRVVSQLTPWPRSAQPRFAGVSSFGVGGTNAHLVVGEAPQQQARAASTDAQLLVLSARTDTALRSSEKLLAESLNNNAQDLADISFTLARGRRAFKQRRYVVARNGTDASDAVLDSKRGMSRTVGKTPAVVFMFPGQGSQQVGMGQALYLRHPVFKEALDECSLGLRAHLGVDLVQDLLYPPEGSTDDSNARLRQTKFAQPALFAVEYALARLWLSLGVEPDVMLGHSIGEFCCAVLAGVFTLQDGLRLVAQRGALMQALPIGAMLTVKAAASALEPKLTAGLSIASINSKNACVVAGPSDAIAALEQQLLGEKIACRQLQTSHAFHSAMMEPAVGPFTREVEKCARSAPTRRFISTATGQFITDEQAQSPAYWASHLRDTVRFADAVETACQLEDIVLLEVGPRTTLSQLTRPQLRDKTKQSTWSSLCDASDGDAEWVALLEATGRLWVHGATIAMEKAFPKGHRVPLPTYPFEGEPHWVEAVASSPQSEDVSQERTEHQILPVLESSMSRISHIQNELRSLFEDVSGVELGPDDGGQSFIELGLDSLFLTQVATAIQKKFEVKLTFRQLMEQYTTLDGLVGYLDATLPSHVGRECKNASPRSTPVRPSGSGSVRCDASHGRWHAEHDAADDDAAANDDDAANGSNVWCPTARPSTTAGSPTDPSGSIPCHY